MVDYVKLAKVSDRLIKANGRSIILVRPSETPADANQPWNEPTVSDIQFLLMVFLFHQIQ